MNTVSSAQFGSSSSSQNAMKRASRPAKVALNANATSTITGLSAQRVSAVRAERGGIKGRVVEALAVIIAPSVVLQHDPEKWVPVFGKRSCSNKGRPVAGEEATGRQRARRRTKGAERAGMPSTCECCLPSPSKWETRRAVASETIQISANRGEYELEMF